MPENRTLIRKFFQELPNYTPLLEQVVTELADAFGPEKRVRKGEIIKDLATPNKDFFFIKEGFLKEMYKNTYTGEDDLFNIIPPKTIFVNEDTLFFNMRPAHYYVAYTSVRYFRLRHADYMKIMKEFPELQQLYLGTTLRIQKNRRARLTMLRMSSTQDRINWVKTNRPDIYRILDRTTLAQYIAVSRASLYRAAP